MKEGVITRIADRIRGFRTAAIPSLTTNLPTKTCSVLDWSKARIDHVREHVNPSVSKLEHGVFYGNPVEVTNEAWQIAQQQGIKPIQIGGRDHYIIPRANSGYASGAIGNRENLNHVILITEGGTNQVVTCFPSFSTTDSIRAFINKMAYGE